LHGDDKNQGGRRLKLNAQKDNDKTSPSQGHYAIAHKMSKKNEGYMNAGYF
jgi:hypothetical protein